MKLKIMWLFQAFTSVWRYRGFITSVVRREFQSRYAGSMLGLSWNIINPLILIVIYTLVFSNLMHNRIPGMDDSLAYGIYLCAGLLPWGLFSEIINRSQTIFLENSNLLKKSNFPHICLPITLIITSLIDFFIIFGLFLMFLTLTARFPGLIILTILPVLIIQLMISTGLGILTGTLNVIFRDIGKLMSVVLQFWFWLTPIVYPMQVLSKEAMQWLSFNPMVAIFSSYQAIFLNHRMPQWLTLLPALVLGVVLLFLSSFTFYRLSGDLVDEL